jgi:UDP-N-acetylmuramoyl-tripeptide--D-alanyl-D-alanine ligase
MTQLFTAQELVTATGGEARGLPEGVASISIDSRELGPDALFVAIKGDRFDGHDFVADAFASGAAAAMISREKAVGLAGPLLIVSDPLDALRKLARAARARSRARIVAVTGSVGKTTTKEAMRIALSAAGETHASVKSFNNHWGVPLTLARLPRDTAFGVFEIGMNHAGEITPLVQLVRPHIAVVTSIAPAHLAAFDSIEDIARAKAEIFAGLEPGGVALLNTDHQQIDLLREEAKRAGARVVTYGFAADADWRIEGYQAIGDAARADVRHSGGAHSLEIAAPGRHMIANATAALAAATLCGISPETALAALSRFGTQAGRGQKTLLGEGENPLVLIDESYNANTASMLAALEVFGEQAAAGKKVLVLGDMLELGERSAELHAALKDAVLASGAERIYLVGEHMAALADALGPERVTASTRSASELMEPLLTGLAYGDTVMVKGSNGVRLSSLIERIRDKFQAPSPSKDS